ncbi:hypothetical protein [Zwartia sp.]|uniref:hypothetical protein n=1 Tax=Zwartia sp. TaxID=2978004 RepID=UPI002723320F|nr:hypothetical protein [Zwartia sp.]MDO9024718.1 hypothetical protein [Zwartia sp.]
MTSRRFIDPSATANLSAEELSVEYEELYFAYKDLMKRHRKLVPIAQEKAAVITAKREHLRRNHVQRVVAGQLRHEPTRRQVEYFIHRYWDLQQSPQHRRVTADRIRRDLADWVRAPQPIYGIDMPEDPLDDLAESTARKIFTACGKALRECNGDKAIFFTLTRERRT